MAYKIAIIGGGWYGCHIGLALQSLQMDVTVFEKADRPLHYASGNNQFRLHQGFHYARHHGTRIQSRDGFIRFTERYPNLSAPIKQNLYAVPRETSLMDFDTYKLIMVSSGIPFVEMPEGSPYLTNIDGVIKTDERVILLDNARNYFSQRLKGNLHLNTAVEAVSNSEDGVVINGVRYDYAIDATWGHYTKPPIKLIYEPTILLYYETSHDMPAVTFVDGPLSSVYPTEDPSIFTLSSVVHTPLGQFSTPEEAVRTRDDVTGAVSLAKRQAMEAQISENFPKFRDYFRFAGVQLAIKTKPVGNFDDRSCYVYRDRRLFSVLSGKIDTVFFAVERILASIETEQSNAGTPSIGPIKGDILQRELADKF
ncbi:FAD-dependent oxidoreductase [Asticcacaulis excentricus]|uniref:FAD dependent oxidoreductase n=1 Tax=Asticcacaulis excentricus (strain ATCC 15261 / DSM 4724 / KCTC 12464 / NCIMB 9791 / VKM B-1370 / CB 48) TaxID=573065 RepID=E8RMP6_ASTEC|nr:FAD-dependent oxidoreductase [Asticcacaulis excentricus]ADU13927.1 FAD dependent oxidoreductase [Asticcacaulis excentricus CB 48]